MVFGMQDPVTADFMPIVKFDTRAGRLLRSDYDEARREKVTTDITSPPPKFAFDFGTLEVGYGTFSQSGPDFHVVPEGQPIPPRPSDRDDKGRLLYKSVFRVRLLGTVLGGVREFASSARVVLQATEELYNRYKSAPEAWAGKIPITELTRTLPGQMGKAPYTSTVYTPVFTIVGWANRDEAILGPRLVPVPQPPPAVPSSTIQMASASVAVPSAPPPGANGGGRVEDDELPFSMCWQ
jgi:hypothetical protein